ncbi:MAG: VOC family protein [Flavobacteriia bacterium]|nr:VOC family protein [Flavobacteriia bacterium]
MPFRLDHLSYATSHDQLVDVVQRLGSRIGSAFIDGGIHPRFGTRNFTLPLKHGHYLEVVCPLDHPAAEESAFGKAVSKRANEGGGWMSWVVATNDISPVEARLGRNSVEGSRKRPDGSELKWKQLGVLGTIEDSQLPFFIQWLSSNHPSSDGKANSHISKIEISGDEKTIESWLGSSPKGAFKEVDVIYQNPANSEGTGILSVTISTPHGEVFLD